MNCSDQLQCYAVPTYPTSIVVVRYFDTVGNRISNDPIVREKTQKNTGEKSIVVMLVLKNMSKCHITTAAHLPLPTKFIR